ncbi:MAG: ABC transporter permease [Defluviitaleaceae bacterium]|nr:ABC transporter permease [Defluviitaleaceae bacterium]
MHLRENIQLALEGLRANKMRSLLTMLGIIIGIAAVVGIVTVGDGMTTAVTGHMGGLGANNITVHVSPRGGGGGPMDNLGGTQIMPQEHDRITNNMIDLFVEMHSNSVAAIGLTSPAGVGHAQFDSMYSHISVVGVNSGYQITSGANIFQGNFISDEDVFGASFVAVVSDVLVAELFEEGQNPLGQNINAVIGSESKNFTIIGVFEHNSSPHSFASSMPIIGGGGGQIGRTHFYIPISTANQISENSDTHQSFTITAQPNVNMGEFEGVVRGFFSEFYADNPRFRIGTANMDRILNMTEDIMGTMAIAVAVIAGISLIVGGVGVMNIMLVSVTERTREIGTRKALGARNSSIRMQFIVEAVIICGIGGILGIILGVILGYLGSSLLGYAALPTMPIIIISVIFSMTIGLFFGYYPASKAAKLSPIEALRHE